MARDPIRVTTRPVDQSAARDRAASGALASRTRPAAAELAASRKTREGFPRVSLHTQTVLAETAACSDQRRRDPGWRIGRRVRLSRLDLRRYRQPKSFCGPKS